MKALISLKSGSFASLALAALLGLVLISAPAAQAVRYLSDGSNDAVEGDPLDSNDYGSGDGGLIGDDVHDSYKSVISGGGGLIITRSAGESRVFLIVDFRGKIPVMRVIRVSGTSVQPEGPDAR